VAVLVLSLSLPGVGACAAPLEKTAASAVGQGSSAVSTSVLALDLLIREKAGSAAVETSLEDMAGELEEARKELLDKLPATAGERRLHREADSALERAQAALALARHVLVAKDSPGQNPGDPGLKEARSALDTAAAELDSLRKRLGPGR
jgi:hypothetical protein